MAQEVKIVGLKELDAALAKLPENIQRKLLGQSLSKAAEPMRKAAAAAVPIRDEPGVKYSGKGRKPPARVPGHLKAHIIKRLRRVNGIPTVFIAWARSAFYGAYLEFGSSRQAPQPFMRPAFDQEAIPTVQRFGKDLGPKIEREARKLASRR